LRHTCLEENIGKVLLAKVTPSSALQSFNNFSILCFSRQPVGNPYPGTVIDNGCIPEGTAQFYLISQATTQGTEYILFQEKLITVHLLFTKRRGIPYPLRDCAGLHPAFY